MEDFTYKELVALLDYGDQFAIDRSTLEVFSTIRYDPLLSPYVPVSVDDVVKDNFYLLSDHVARLRMTLHYFHSFHDSDSLPRHKTTLGVIYKALIGTFRESNLPTDQPYKFRLLVTLQGDAHVEIHPAPERANLLDALDDAYAGEHYDLYVDEQAILVSPYTLFKTTRRDVYNDARARMLPNLLRKEEVILVSATGEATEGSITNIAIKNKAGEWVTPPLSSGCLCGVMRKNLVQSGAVTEGPVPAAALKLGTEVLLMNAIIGTARGTVVSVGERRPVDLVLKLVKGDP